MDWNLSHQSFMQVGSWASPDSVRLVRIDEACAFKQLPATEGCNRKQNHAVLAEECSNIPTAWQEHSIAPKDLD